MALPPPPPSSAPPPPPPPAPPRPPGTPPPPPAPAKGGNRTVIIVICVIVGIILLIGGCVSTCTYFAAKKAREYTRNAQRNPAYASLSLAASLSPDIQVLSKDETSGKITVRNKKTGETVTINTNDYTAANIGRALEEIAKSAQVAAVRESTVTQSATAAAPEPTEREEQTAPAPEPKISAGKAAAMTATLGNFPKYLPAYPGATTVESQLNNMMGMTMGNYAAVTTDKPDDVVGFYEKKLTAAGFTIVGQNNDSNDNGPVRALSATISGPQRTVAVTATSEAGGKVRLEITYAAMSK